jgi:hypothetical protein
VSVVDWEELSTQKIFLALSARLRSHECKAAILAQVEIIVLGYLEHLFQVNFRLSKFFKLG